MGITHGKDRGAVTTADQSWCIPAVEVTITAARAVARNVIFSFGKAASYPARAVASSHDGRRELASTMMLDSKKPFTFLDLMGLFLHF